MKSNEALKYYPFGSVMRSMQSGNNRYLYQGEYAEYDGETGWHHFDLRSYDAVIGRWLSVDPMGQHPSPYLGMGNNPVNRIDPDGGFDWYTNDQTGELHYFEGQTGAIDGHTWVAGDNASLADINSALDFLGLSHQLLNPVSVSPSFFDRSTDGLSKWASTTARDVANGPLYVGSGVLSPIVNQVSLLTTGQEAELAKVWTIATDGTDWGWRMNSRPLDNGSLSNAQMIETVHYTTDVLLMPISPFKASIGSAVKNFGANFVVNTAIKAPIKVSRDFMLDYHKP